MPRKTVRLGLLTLGWYAFFFLLSRYGVDLLPRAWASRLSLEQYLLAVQAITLAVVLVVARSFLVDGLSDLALRAPESRIGVTRVLVVAALLSPLVYVISSSSAIAAAYSTLIEEIRRGGVASANANAGEFGRTLAQAPLLTTLLWAAVFAPLGEELLFRGALWSTIQSWIGRSPVVEESAPSSLDPARFVRPLGPSAQVGPWLRSGGLAWLVTTMVFGALHADMPGGQGIIRVVSTTLVGAAAGLGRWVTGSVWTAVVLHVGANTLSLAASRSWLVTERFPRLYAIPRLAILLSGVFLLAAVVVLFASKKAAPGRDLPNHS